MSVDVVCIDVTGSKRAMDIAFSRDGCLRLTTVSTLQDFQGWLSANSARVIAVDAPSKANIGLVPQFWRQYGVPEGSYENFRVCEALLRLKGIGLYNTPQDKPPAWMLRGWDLYSLLKPCGYTLIDQPGPLAIGAGEKRVLEVHPHASFVVGLGWKPQSKQSLAGQLERVAYLRRECRDLALNFTGTFLEADYLEKFRQLNTTWDAIREDGICLPAISHDELDAVAGLTTALRAMRGEAFAVGHQDDGVIVLPKKLSDVTYPQ